METAVDSETKVNGPSFEKPSDKYSINCDDDGVANATENLVTSESKTPLKTPLKEGDADIQVKFIVNDSANGDAKIDIDNVKSAFAGMAKEELMKYANDPFWIRTRLFLFIFFWAVWIAMFVGAIAIIVMAPRCEAPKRPAWFQEGPLYEVDVKEFVDDPKSENLILDLINKLDYLVDLKIKGIILSPFLKSVDGDENVIDFTNLNDDFGTLNDFENLTTAFKEKGIHVIMSFVPNHSSDKHPWFIKSIDGIAPYDNYYVWAPSKGGSQNPPNNWLTGNGNESAWTWNEKRKQFYLHQFGVNQPDLNFTNPAVIKEFNDTLSHWLKLGVSGFNLDKVQYLLENENLKDETQGNTPGFIHTDYGFYNHFETHNRPQVANILSSWRDIVHETKEDGVLIITGEAPIPTDRTENTTIVDLERSEKLTSSLKPNFTAHDLCTKLEKLLDSSRNSKSWPTIQIGGKNSRITDVYGEDHVDGLNMITTLLPATQFTYFGEELGISSNKIFPRLNETSGTLTFEAKEKNHYDVYKELSEAKDSQAVLYGSHNLTELMGSVLAANGSKSALNESVLTLTRIKSGSPGYLVVYNPSGLNITVDLIKIECVPDELTVLARSLNYGLDINQVKDKIKSKDFILTPKSAFTFTFVPKKE